MMLYSRTPICNKCEKEVLTLEKVNKKHWATCECSYWKLVRCE
jgi:hypothetical protein